MRTEVKSTDFDEIYISEAHFTAYHQDKPQCMTATATSNETAISEFPTLHCIHNIDAELPGCRNRSYLPSDYSATYATSKRFVVSIVHCHQLLI
jgi:hypothetical protein